VGHRDIRKIGITNCAKKYSGAETRVFAFTAATGLPVTGGAAQLSCKVSKNSGTATALADTSATEVEDGYYLFDLTQAETNGDTLDFYPESSTSGVVVIVTNHDRQTVSSPESASGPVSGGGAFAPVFFGSGGGGAGSLRSQEANVFKLIVGERSPIAITCLNAAEVAVNLTGKTLRLAVETLNRVAVDEFTPSISGSTFTFTTSAALTSVKRTLIWTLWEGTSPTKTPLMLGRFSVDYSAQ